MRERNVFIPTSQRKDLTQLSPQELEAGLRAVNFVRNTGTVVILAALSVFASQFDAAVSGEKWETAQEAFKAMAMTGLNMGSFSVGINMFSGALNESRFLLAEAHRRGLKVRGRFFNRQIELPLV